MPNPVQCPPPGEQFIKTLAEAKLVKFIKISLLSAYGHGPGVQTVQVAGESQELDGYYQAEL